MSAFCRAAFSAKFVEVTPIFVADESCPWPIVAAVRKAGFNVTSIQEEAPGTLDDDILRNSFLAGRVVVTQDRDFGELVMRGVQRRLALSTSGYADGIGTQYQFGS